MSKLTLRARTLGTAILALLLFIPLIAFTLERAFTHSLTQAMEEQLRVQNLGLISEFELVGGEIRMPPYLFNDQLNLPDSGTYGFIAMHMLPAWQSESAVSWQQQPQLNLPPVGRELFTQVTLDEKDYFQFSYTASFEDQGRLFPITFHILRDASVYAQQLNDFRQTLWFWLGVIMLLLIVTLTLGLRAALRPVATLNQQIAAIEQGQKQQVEGEYPDELDVLKQNLNHLLASQLAQRSRYRNSLSDLAHALKTPLAVLAGMHNLPADAQSPLEQIKQQINRQLKRAVSIRDASLQQGFAVVDACHKLIDAMDKVHAEKQLSIECELADDARFFGDMTDFTELLGNLLDNACKAARHQVLLQVSDELGLKITLADDGPGIAPEQQQWLLQRGARLDTYQEGQGIGMAIVADLLLAYGGQMQIGSSALGGALFTLHFPRPSDV